MMLIVLQLVLFCALFALMVKLAVGNNALNALYFYPKPVQERVYFLGLTDRETVARKRKLFMIPFMIIMLCTLLLIIGVHHGGNTTNGMGLRAGLPTLIIALALDQYFYGRMDHKLNLGPKPLYIRKRLCTVQEIREALADLLTLAISHLKTLMFPVSTWLVELSDFSS